MAETNQEDAKIFIKIGIYVLGSILGISAKLASMHKAKPLTWTTAIVEFLIAAAASFFVWAYFHFIQKQDDMAIVSSVIVGRYGDKMLYVGYKFIENMFKSNKEDKESEKE